MERRLSVAEPQVGCRLDHVLVASFPDFSRAAWGKRILSGAVLVNGDVVKAGYKLRPGDEIIISFLEKNSSSLSPEKINFSVIYEDRDIIVVDKPAGLVVHPGAGNPNGTLVNALLYRYPDLSGLSGERPGIVHRLDKDTSGVILIARNEFALARLSEDFKNRRVDKTYQSLLLRHPGKEFGRIVAPIDRHPVKRCKMHLSDKGRYAATSWLVKKKWDGYSLVELKIETGRTHQIRVHMASLGSPVLGDKTYGGIDKNNKSLPVARQMLHAHRVVINHPVSGDKMEFVAPLASDMLEMIDWLDSEQ